MASFKTHSRKSASSPDQSCSSPLVRWVKGVVIGLDVCSTGEDRVRPPPASPFAAVQQDGEVVFRGEELWLSRVSQCVRVNQA